MTLSWESCKIFCGPALLIQIASLAVPLPIAISSRLVCLIPKHGGLNVHTYLINFLLLPVWTGVVVYWSNARTNTTEGVDAHHAYFNIKALFGRETARNHLLKVNSLGKSSYDCIWFLFSKNRVFCVTNVIYSCTKLYLHDRTSHLIIELVLNDLLVKHRFTAEPAPFLSK